jgi:hypothetical protein
MRVTLTLLAAFCLASRAWGHSVYEVACCSGLECKPISESDVAPMKEGWLVKITGEIIKYNSWPLKQSPDGQFHRCARHGNFSPNGRTQCLYVPDYGQ